MNCYSFPTIFSESSYRRIKKSAQNHRKEDPYIQKSKALTVEISYDQGLGLAATELQPSVVYNISFHLKNATCIAVNPSLKN